LAGINPGDLVQFDMVIQSPTAQRFQPALEAGVKEEDVEVEVVTDDEVTYPLYTMGDKQCADWTEIAGSTAELISDTEDNENVYCVHSQYEANGTKQAAMCKADVPCDRWATKLVDGKPYCRLHTMPETVVEDDSHLEAEYDNEQGDE